MARKNKQDFIIGIDEVGRGAVAGPLAVAALALPAGFKVKKLAAALNLPLRDSKKLTPLCREKWHYHLSLQPEILFKIATVSARMIDRRGNISKSANRAASRALRRLINEFQIKKARVFLDGGLYLRNSKKPFEKSAKTVVKGDEKIEAVKLASIIAKVHRDRLMKRWHKKIPAYGFHRHKGYGTKKHFAAIRRHGPSKIHRLTFLRKYLKLKKEFKI